MADAYTLVDLDGQLCVRARYQYSDQPQIVVNYYPTGIRAADFKRNYGYELPSDLTYLNPGSYGLASRSLYGSGVIVYLEKGGQTQCVKQELEDIPCPKVRRGIATRFYRGHWQKYLKSKGWVAA